MEDSILLGEFFFGSSIFCFIFNSKYKILLINQKIEKSN